MKFSFAALFLLTCIGQITARAEGNASDQDKAKLQGEWIMVSGSRGGAAFTDDLIKGSKRVATNDETTVTIAGQFFMTAKFTLDVSAKPKKIDYALSAGPNAGKTQLGIYELDGATVKFCFAAPGLERPSDFTTKTGDGRTFSV